MRTSDTRMGGTGEEREPEESPVRAESYLGEGELVIYDPENPMAWIKSNMYGKPEGWPGGEGATEPE